MFDAPENPPADRSENNQDAVESLRLIMHMQQGSRAKDLAAIRQKLKDGHYLTRQAAEESAERMRNDGALD
jgi:hypothetical protein